jgi:hypothetical protein
MEEVKISGDMFGFLEETEVVGSMLLSLSLVDTPVIVEVRP